MFAHTTESLAIESSIVDSIPRSSRNVLLVLTGVVHLGARIKADRRARIVGLALDSHSEEIDSDGLDEVVCVEPHRIETALQGRTFEAVVWVSGFDYIRDPTVALRQLHSVISDDGVLVLCCPNVGQHDVVRTLIAGSWQNAFSDPKAIRFYTKNELEKLLARCNFDIRTLSALSVDSREQRNVYHDTSFQGLGQNADSFRGGRESEFTAASYLATARKSHPRQYGLTSIVMVTHNQLMMTRQAVESVRRFTDEPYEFVFVDNGSEDGTREYLNSVPNSHVIANRSNLGFPIAANQGLCAAEGEHLLLLNNDVIVTTFWLRRLLDALNREPEIGLVGPCSNYVSGPQQVPVSYRDVSSLDGFAWEWGRLHDAELVDTERLVGFCLLLPRRVLNRIGLLDERFRIGCFEDDDYCRRARQAGFRVVIARDAFIHHFGSQTFRALGINYSSLLRENALKFHDKWSQRQGQPTASASTLSTLQCKRTEPAGLRLLPDDIHLSLCMIARDNETTLKPCLESIRPWVDEMIVVDTGSRDRTPHIAEELGAHVYTFPWCDDFSAARNESLKHASGQWVFWMDTDDTITAENGEKLRRLAYSEHAPDVLGYVIKVRCPGKEGHDVTVVDHVKLFRNRPDLRFEFRIHEQIIPSIRRANGDVGWTEISVDHSGADQSHDGRNRKLQRDLRILHREITERPDHPFVLFNMGMTYADAGKLSEAIRHLERSIDLSGPAESQLRKAYALLTSVYEKAQECDKAWKVCNTGLDQFPQDPELLFRRAMLLQDAGKLREAEQDYMAVLGGHEPAHFASVDAGISGFKARHNLALVYQSLGEHSKAEEQWRLILRNMDDYKPAWRGLIDSLRMQSRWEDGLRIAESLKSRPALHALGCILAATLHRSCQQLPRARDELEHGLSEHPDDIHVWQEYCRVLFELKEWSSAADVFPKLIALAPNDPTAYHNFGTVLLEVGRHEEAISAYRHSLGLRPNSIPTRLQLASVLLASSHLEAAAAECRRALEIDPSHPGAHAILDSIQE